MFKKLSIIIILVLTLFTITSCGKNGYITHAIGIGYIGDEAYLINASGEKLSLDKYDYVSDEFGDYITVGTTKRGTTKYGYIDITGQTIVKPKYLWAGLMRENKAVVTSKKGQLIIDNTGKTLYKLPENMSSSSYYQENRLLVEVDGKLAYLDENFKLINGTYDYATVFKNGYANVGIQIDKTIKYGFINLDGSPLFEDNYIFDFVDHFYDGIARVGHILNVENGVPTYSFSYINNEGDTLAIKLNNNLFNKNIIFARNFSSGFAQIGYLSSDRYMLYRYINNEGTIVIGENPSVLHQAKAGDNYIFGSIISDANLYGDMIGVMSVRSRMTGSGSWTTYIIHKTVDYSGNEYIEAANLYSTYSDYTTPWALKYKGNSPIDMTDYKLTKYYPNTALARIQMSDGKCALISSLGQLVIDFDYDKIVY